jgi:putative multiple sugar transport system substrate-binding protein
MSRVKRFLMAVTLGLMACAVPAGAQTKDLVGVSMPTKSAQRWVVEGLSMMRLLTNKNYTADLQYADDDVALQSRQIDAMIANGAKVLVIGAIDGSALTATLDRAAKKGVKVIAYDRLIRQSPNVDVYATFDNFQVGVLQARDIEQRLGLKERKGQHFNIELFAGSLDDNNASFFFNGAMSVLKPYIDQGVLTILSGQNTIEQVATKRWDGKLARTRMNQLLSTVYMKKRVDAILSPYDGMSVEIVAALKSVGYGSTQALPFVTGQDAELPALRSIIRGEQASTVFKDTRELAKVTVDIIDALLSGKPPRINDTTTYNNGVKVVPSFLLKPVLVDKTNWQDLLVKSGYYKEDQFK